VFVATVRRIHDSDVLFSFRIMSMSWWRGAAVVLLVSLPLFNADSPPELGGIYVFILFTGI